MDDIRVGMIGARFMGRAHSSAYKNVNLFFPSPYRPVLAAVSGRDEAHLQRFAKTFGYQSTETSWEQLVARDDVDLIDICTPNVTHRPMALAAAQHGKHILCEKPLAMNAEEARQMYEAAEDAGITHMVGFNYRRVPAIALAKRLIERGEIGTVYHFNAVYYQDWLADPSAPFVWRNDISRSGTGAHGDLNAHTVDLARYLVGEIEAVNGVRETFTKERSQADGTRAPVTTDDACTFLARFQNGAQGSFLATRVALGRKNLLRLEMFGSKGSLSFNLERMNELQFYSAGDSQDSQGFRTILVTESSHPYVEAWWPPGHIIGWGDTFTHEVFDLLVAIESGARARPDFLDGLRCQLVLDAVVQSADTARWTNVESA